MTSTNGRSRNFMVFIPKSPTEMSHNEGSQRDGPWAVPDLLSASGERNGQEGVSSSGYEQ